MNNLTPVGQTLVVLAVFSGLAFNWYVAFIIVCGLVAATFYEEWRAL